MAVTTEALEQSPDTRLVARKLISEGRRYKKRVPSLLDLATAITRISIHDTMLGSSSLTLSLSDPSLVLTTSGFLDGNADGKLDPIELEYPDRSGYWWRLSMVSVTSRQTVDLVFMERAAVLLMGLRGPLKASRASVTRAEFIRMLVLKHHLGLEFHSRDLHKTQPIEVPTTPTDAKKKKKAKDPGIAEGTPLSIVSYDGSRHLLTKEQVANAETVLTAAEAVTKDERAVLALLCACIVEAPFFSNPVGGDATSSGILQLLSGSGPPRNSTSLHGGRRDIALVATLFLTKGFWVHGGAIELAKQNPTMTPGEIAYRVQGCAAELRGRYQKVIEAAKTVKAAYGGLGDSSSGTTTPGKTKKQYHFQVGSSDNPRETYWDAMQRLASEVGWALFIDGQDVYFDPETRLIRQKPVAVINRMHEGVIDWSYDWDQRNIATEMVLTVVCEPFAFHAGEVVLLVGFGPASTGSAAKPPLPGRWLIGEVERDRAAWVSVLTLRQPVFPGPEPAGQAVTTPDSTGGGGPISGTPKHIIDTIAIPIAAANGVAKTPAQNDIDNHNHTHLGNASDHAGPPNVKWAADFGIGPDIRHGNAAGAIRGDKVAAALAKRFGLPWHGAGAVSATHDGFRFQMLWRYESAQAGNHFTHVHFGIRRA